MKVLLSTVLMIIAYLLFFAQSSLSVFIATCIIFAVFTLWLFDFPRSHHHFRPFIKFSWYKGLFLALVGFILFALNFSLFSVGPVFAKELRHKLIPSGFGEGEGDQQNGSDQGTNQDEANIYKGNNEEPEIRIPRRGGPQDTSFPEVQIKPTDQASSTYLKSFKSYVSLKYLDKFDGHSRWSVSNPHLRTWTKDDSGKIELHQPEFGAPVQYQVRHAANIKLLHSLHGLSTVELDTLLSFGEGYRLSPIETETPFGRVYSCVSYPVRFSNLPNAEKSKLQLAEAEIEYLTNTLSPEFRERLKNWTSALKQFPTLAQRISGVETILRNNCRYTLDVQNPRNIPPIENFMFHENAGYCLHFASAAVILCRELGIPARLVSGYAGGTHFSNHDMWVFYTDNAHSWAEIKLEGLGWVILETTPSQGVSVNETSSVTPPVEFLTQQERESALQETALIDTEELGQAVHNETKKILRVIVILFAILLAIDRLEKRSQRKRNKDQENKDDRGQFEERVYLKIYRKMSRLLGLPMMNGDTLQYHVNWLKEKQSDPCFADELLHYHYATTYRGEDQDRIIEARLIKQIREWKR
jgi:transglutaminase-like putative cysteine protease